MRRRSSEPTRIAALSNRQAWGSRYLRAGMGCRGQVLLFVLILIPPHKTNLRAIFHCMHACNGLAAKKTGSLDLSGLLQAS